MASRKRPRGEDGYEGIPPYSVRGEVHRQLTRDVSAGDVLAAPTHRATLQTDDGSTSTKVGATQGLAKRARLEPPFSGAGPGAPTINGMAVLNPGTAMPMRNAPTAAATYFQNDDGRTLGWIANNAIVVAVNCLTVAGSKSLTAKALGQFHCMFLLRPEDKDQTVHRETIRDAQIVSVSMLNNLLHHSTDEDARVKYGTTLQSVLQRWVPWGVLQTAGTPSGDPDRQKNQPTAVLFFKGFTKCLNYWAACSPTVRNGAILWWLWCRRPKDERLANTYRDMLNALMSIEVAPSDERLCNEVETLIDNIHDFEDAHEHEAWPFVLEPAVTYSMAEPDKILYNRGQGYAIRYARMLEGCAQMSPPQKYLVNTHRLLHVTSRTLDFFDAAAQAQPTCRIGLFG